VEPCFAQLRPVLKYQTRAGKSINDKCAVVYNKSLMAVALGVLLQFLICLQRASKLLRSLNIPKVADARSIDTSVARIVA